MPTAPFLVSLTFTQPTAAVPSGAFRLVANAGDSVGPLTLSVPGLTNGIVSMNAAAGFNEYAYEQDGVPAGTYAPTVHDASPAAYPAFDAPAFTLNPAPTVPACIDPDSDNYTPNSNAYNVPLLCRFSPKLALAQGPPALAALGRPVWAVLNGARVLWSTPGPASGSIAVNAPAAGAVLTVNGYRFVVGPPATPDRFQDADTLAGALLGVPALAAAYDVSVLGPRVQLTARAVGPAGNLTLATSDAVGTAVATTDGQPTYHSERRAAWGCWLEVYALPGLAFGGSAKAGAQLAGRFEGRYRADNAYQFDIADCLRAFTGLSYDCADRVVGYFLRYGETFADAAGGYRRARPAAAETDVFFGLEAVEIVRPGNDNARLLTRRPGAWQANDGSAPQVAALPAAGPAVALGPYAGPTYPTQTGQAPVLHFANGQGGRDAMPFEGLREEITKRTASLFSTPTGQGTQRAETPPAFRLQTGVLPREEWDWLRLELGNSPAVWLETPGGPAPLVLTALSTDADEVKGEYTLAVECAYCLQPALGLTN